MWFLGVSVSFSWCVRTTKCSGLSATFNTGIIIRYNYGFDFYAKNNESPWSVQFSNVMFIGWLKYCCNVKIRFQSRTYSLDTYTSHLVVYICFMESQCCKLNLEGEQNQIDKAKGGQRMLRIAKSRFASRSWVLWKCVHSRAIGAALDHFHYQGTSKYSTGIVYRPFPQCCLQPLPLC